MGREALPSANFGPGHSVPRRPKADGADHASTRPIVRRALGVCGEQINEACQFRPAGKFVVPTRKPRQRSPAGHYLDRWHM